MNVPPPEAPNQLSEYCESNGFLGLALIAFVAHGSSSLATVTTNDKQAQHGIEIYYFAYLLGYAMWVGDKNKKFDPLPFGRRALKNLPGSDAFTENRSREVADLIRRFYSDKGNVEFADNYYCGFRTDVSLETMRARLKENAVFRFTICDKWGWSDEQYEAAIATINENRVGPPFFYAEENETLREFWNYAFIAVIAEKFGTLDSFEDILKPQLLWFLLSSATQETRRFVLAADFKDF